MSKSIQQMTDELIQTWSNYTKQGTKERTHETALHDLPYQVGSLSKLYLQHTNYRYNEGLSEAEIKSKMADELADIIAEVLFFAHHMDIDLDIARKDMLKSDEKKISERS